MLPEATRVFSFRQNSDAADRNSQCQSVRCTSVLYLRNISTGTAVFELLWLESSLNRSAQGCPYSCFVPSGESQLLFFEQLTQPGAIRSLLVSNIGSEAGQFEMVLMVYEKQGAHVMLG